MGPTTDSLKRLETRDPGLPPPPCSQICHSISLFGTTSHTLREDDQWQLLRLWIGTLNFQGSKDGCCSGPKVGAPVGPSLIFPGVLCLLSVRLVGVVHGPALARGAFFCSSVLYYGPVITSSLPSERLLTSSLLPLPFHLSLQVFAAGTGELSIGGVFSREFRCVERITTPFAPFVILP
jgi:hypothetical protein